MNEYIKIDKREMIFDFFVKSVIETERPPKNATYLITSVFVNCKVVTRVC